MVSSFTNIFREITPRARLGLVVLLVIACIAVFDWGNRVVINQKLENTALKRKLVELEALRTEGDLTQLISDAELTWGAYETLLLQDETEGLNVAGLQSDVISTLTQCGLEQIIANVETEPKESDIPWHTYRVSVRARDADTQFPLCLDALAQLDIGLIVTALNWRRGGRLQFTLTAFSAPLVDTPQGEAE